MNDQQLLDYLRIHHPYLLDVEMATRELVDKGGFGEVSINIKMHRSKVTHFDVMPIFKKAY